MRLRPRAVLEILGDLFFPPHCAGCRAAVASGWFCHDCKSNLKRLEPPRCETCSQPYAGGHSAFVCANCRGRAFYFECAVAPMRSRGVLRDVIHRFKYGGELWLARPLGEFLALGLDDPRLAASAFVGIVPVPLHPLREREREFNQAEVLARGLSERMGVPVLKPLERVRYTQTQTHFDRDQRMQNLRNAFCLRQNADVHGKDLLLVDDVLTTGSTLDECARMLLEAGAQSVRALTVARG